MPSPKGKLFCNSSSPQKQKASYIKKRADLPETKARKCSVATSLDDALSAQQSTPSLGIPTKQKIAKLRRSNGAIRKNSKLNFTSLTDDEESICVAEECRMPHQVLPYANVVHEKETDLVPREIENEIDHEAEAPQFNEALQASIVANDFRIQVQPSAYNGSNLTTTNPSRVLLVPERRQSGSQQDLKQRKSGSVTPLPKSKSLPIGGPRPRRLSKRHSSNEVEETEPTNGSVVLPTSKLRRRGVSRSISLHNTKNSIPIRRAASRSSSRSSRKNRIIRQTSSSRSRSRGSSCSTRGHSTTGSRSRGNSNSARGHRKIFPLSGEGETRKERRRSGCHSILSRCASPGIGKEQSHETLSFQQPGYPKGRRRKSISHTPSISASFSSLMLDNDLLLSPDPLRCQSHMNRKEVLDSLVGRALEIYNQDFRRPSSSKSVSKRNNVQQQKRGEESHQPSLPHGPRRHRSHCSDGNEEIISFYRRRRSNSEDRNKETPLSSTSGPRRRSKSKDRNEESPSTSPRRRLMTPSPRSHKTTQKCGVLVVAKNPCVTGSLLPDWGDGETTKPISCSTMSTCSGSTHPTTA